MEWQIEFYEFEDGKKPVFNFIESLPTKDKAKVYYELELLEEYGIQLGPPRTNKIEGERYKGLWEIRVRFSSNSYRIFYFLYTRKLFVLLHANIKKKNKTDKSDLEISRKRMLDYKERFK